jgi:mRNA interferase MazF
MTTCKRGDVILVTFVFTDESGMKQRPAVVVSTDSYNNKRGEAIISAITSRVDRALAGDHLVVDWKGAGLLFPSVATGIIRTVKQNMIVRKIGVMPYPDMLAIDNNLGEIFGLN